MQTKTMRPFAPIVASACRRRVRRFPTFSHTGTVASPLAHDQPTPRRFAPPSPPVLTFFGMRCIGVHEPPALQRDKQPHQPGTGSWSGHGWAQYIKTLLESYKRFSSNEQVRSPFTPHTAPPSRVAERGRLRALLGAFLCLLSCVLCCLAAEQCSALAFLRLLKAVLALCVCFCARLRA